MTREEHYAEAERLLAVASRGVVEGAPVGFNSHQDVVAQAQLQIGEYEDFILPALALPYADRPGYRDQWRP